MANSYYNMLHLQLDVSMETYDPNEATTLNVDMRDKIDTLESENVDSPIQHTVELKKDDADIEVIPPSLSGVKFVYIRVKSENLASAPADGQVIVKITSPAGTNQTIKGSLIMVRDKNAEITSIKITNNEDNVSGVTLPVLVVLGGK